MISRTIFITQPCRLSLRDKQLVVEYSGIKGQEDMADKSVPVEDLGMVVLEHRQISITHALLDSLTRHNVAVITCDQKSMPSGLFLPLEGNTLQSERYREQIEASEPLKKQLWQQTVMAKIRNQASVLDKWDSDSQFLIERSKQVKSGDKGNEEAVCSYYYWKRIFPPAWNFSRNRNGLPPNNLLNYGYAIIRAAMARSLVGAGLQPTYGIFHRNRYNAYCLADDIMEPYRPYVDNVVRGIISQTSNIETLTLEHKNALLRLMSTDVIIDGRNSPLMVAIQKTAYSLTRCFSGEQRVLLYPILR